MFADCTPHHDWFAAALTTALCVGLVLSYVPQHLRIVNKNSSEGFSPWFLLLGSTSSASGMLNMVTLQWGVIKCCRVVSAGNCLEMTGGVFQVTMQWFLFTVIQVLFIIYYPPHLKYMETTSANKPRTLSPEWRSAIVLTWAVFVHIVLITLITFSLLLTAPPRGQQIALWATFLGVSSAVLAAIQYAPQLMHTYRHRLVGALSIPMMLIQSPGAAFMVLSIALRPGTNWTSWIMYAVSGIMQGVLLVMCIAWKMRQRRLGIDDFGHPLDADSDATADLDASVDPTIPVVLHAEDGAQGAERAVLHSAIDDAAYTDVRDGLEETTPLLGKREETKGGWFAWFRR